MDPRSLPKLITSLLLGLLAFAFSGGALADPPGRVARLAYVSGSSSFSPGGEREWVRAIVNRPLVGGDRLWVDAGARAELQLGAAAIRIAGGTSITLLNLDDRVAQVQLTQGTLNIRVRRLDRGHVFEVDTPNLAYVIRRPGSYRIQVDADGGATTVIARTGVAEVYGEGRAFITRERQAYRFYGSGLRDYETFALAAPDAFDRFSNERDRRWDNSASRRYVSPELIGYDDLDQYGTWRKVPDYGFVWTPTRVAADWAPYRDGHWAWVEPWGWTWVDDAPWGFAPSHYGRWAHLDSGWSWVPGPVAARPVYAPALVAFVGGSNLRISGSGGNGAVGWFPLAPREVYRPSYAASREYFSSVNTSNTVIDRTRVVNQYNTTNVTNITYVNQQVPGAVVAMLAAAFAQSRPVAKESVRVTREMAVGAPATAVAPIAPVHASVVGGAPPSAKPPEAAQARRVVAQAAPPPPPVSFAAKQSALAANAGKPLDTAALAALKPAAPASAPAVNVVTATPPVALPAKPASASLPSGPASSAQAPSVAQGASAAEQPMRASSGRARPPSAAAPASASVPASASASAAARTPAAVPAPAASPAPTASRATEPPLGRPGLARERQAAEAARISPPAASAPSPRDSAQPRAEEERATRAPTAAKRSPEPPSKPTSVDAAPAAAPPPIVPAAPKAAVPASKAPQPGEAPRVREPRQSREAPGEAPPRSAAPARQAEPPRSAPPPAVVSAPPPPAAAARQAEPPRSTPPPAVVPVPPPPAAAARAASAAPPATPAPATRAPATPPPPPAPPAARPAPPAAPATTAPAAEPRARRAGPDEARAPGRREAASDAKKAASDARNPDERRK